MNTTDLLDALEYSTSPRFVAASEIRATPDHAHIFRRAINSCRLVGSFSLKPSKEGRTTESTPVVFVAEASSDREADDIHRRIWNQNIAPFLLVQTGEHVRLYSGFEYAPAQDNGTQGGLLKGLVRFDQVLTQLADFRASAIEDGSLWRNWGTRVRPEARVDWKLLSNLEELGKRLHDDHLNRPTAHALIGKFVYLRYLRDRGILSNKKLAEWKIDPDNIFSNQHLTIDALEQVISHVDAWLNGSIFPFSFSQVRQKHLALVAGVFLGNDAATQQLHLDFQAYDFSHIPIETLSVIYEQFLRLEGKNKPTGAYYTPLAVVNFMLAELDAIRPLKPGMKVLDPSCGSGAFLVQCYRRFAEAHVRETNGRPRPAVLRDLLVKHVFGVDRDPDACRVAQLSLVLTMLDYINPPDLTSITSKFKLPELHNKNIFESDFFDPKSLWAAEAATESYSWVVGNPPWTQVNAKEPGDFRHTLAWIVANRSEKPAVQNEAAEAFAWRVAENCASGGVIAMLLPAMTLFRTAPHFRKRFFSTMAVHSVANFANLREVLFAGRSRMPAAAIFYHPPARHKLVDTLVYSPLVVNQEATRPKPATRQETWSILLNSSEVRRLSIADTASGDNLPWKLALWGSHRDARLLKSVEGRFDSLGAFIKKRGLVISEGLQLREKKARERTEPLPEVIGRFELDVKLLRKRGRIHSLPHDALRPIEPSRAYARKGRGALPLAVSRPPHLIISADRRFAFYTNEFVVIPARQIGIAGSANDSDELKMLAVFLNSSFSRYYEFLRSPQLGVRDGRSTLDALQKLPTPLSDLSSQARREWLKFHDAMVTSHLSHESRDFILDPDSVGLQDEASRHQRVLDALVSDALGLSDEERVLVHDLVEIRMPLVDGQVAGPAIRPPTFPEVGAYVQALEHALNAFTDDGSNERHHINAVVAGVGGVTEIAFGALDRAAARAPIVRNADQLEEQRLKHIFAQLSARHSQWLYFDRNLFVHQEDRSYILKPAQLLWWTRSQALADADEMIAAITQL
jgi:hypothetical protein